MLTSLISDFFFFLVTLCVHGTVQKRNFGLIFYDFMYVVYTVMVRNIVVPVDPSEHAARAFAWAVANQVSCIFCFLVFFFCFFGIFNLF
jgi:hypothetical protein